MMKKFTATILSIFLLLSLFACTVNENDLPSPTDVTNYTEEETLPSASEVVPTEAQSDILEWANSSGYSFDEDAQVKNIILMIGDGMGENIIKNAEIVKGAPYSTSYMPYSAYVGTDSLSGTTDSAAASTAISCGIKTRNQYIGIDENYEPVETIVEFAKARGLKTGLVATQIIPHATPAGMIAHQNYRNLYNGILKQMVKAEVDVLMGGGAEYTDTEKMQMRINEKGYTYIKTPEELATVSKGEKVMGAFSYFDLNATKNPSLTTMTAKALELLDGDDGFFLMVEASHIDIFEAKEDMDSTISEMQAFDKAIDYALSWAESHPGTLVLVTADHETGGVTVPDSGLPEDVTNDLFTSGGEHTSEDVLVFAAGAQAGNLFVSDRIENTDISLIMRRVLNDTYGEAPVSLLNIEE